MFIFFNYVTNGNYWGFIIIIIQFIYFDFSYDIYGRWQDSMTNACFGILELDIKEVVSFPRKST